MKNSIPCINQYVYRSRVKKFLMLSKEEWMRAILASHTRTTHYPPGDSQIAAWEDEFDTLCTALRALPEEYGELEIIFEYVMPKRIDCEGKTYTKRADVILLSGKTVAVLEFKRYKEANIYLERQLLGYRRRLQKWHVQSRGMNKRAILVLTRAKQPQNEHKYKCWACSPEWLAEVIRATVDTERMPSERVKQWVGSDWRAASEEWKKTRTKDEE